MVQKCIMEGVRLDGEIISYKYIGPYNLWEITYEDG